MTVSSLSRENKMLARYQKIRANLEELTRDYRSTPMEREYYLHKVEEVLARMKEQLKKEK